MSSSSVVLAFRREDMSMDADSSSGETRDGDPAWVPSKPGSYKYKYKIQVQMQKQRDGDLARVAPKLALFALS